MVCIHIISREELCHLLSTRVAKYNSQHDKSRHYELEYNNNECECEYDFDVTTSLFVDGVKRGESHAHLSILENGEMFVKYTDVLSSPHPTSPFHPDNSFYPRLFGGYRIGPLYSVCPIDPDAHFVIPLMYHIEDGRVKILNFYRK